MTDLYLERITARLAEAALGPHGDERLDWALDTARILLGQVLRLDSMAKAAEEDARYHCAECHPRRTTAFPLTDAECDACDFGSTCRALVVYHCGKGGD